MYTEKTTNAKCTASTGLALALALFTTASFFPLHTYAASTMLEEITVTARKREELLQDIPITVNAFTETALEERGIASLNDIADATPGFDFAQGFGRQDFRPAIRGQSTIQGRANAGLFIDGIIVEAGAATVPLAALERVEIVKGPQSALYGRSTLAGAINYVLKKPAEDFAGEASVQHGQRGYFRVEGHASGPINEAAGFALTLAHYQRDGEYDNFYPGNRLESPSVSDEVGGEETSSAVALFTFSPTEQLDITAHAIYEKTDDDQYAIDLQPASFNNCFISAPTNPNRSTGADGMPLTQPLPPEGTPEANAGGFSRRGAASLAYNGSGYYCGAVDVDTVLNFAAPGMAKAEQNRGRTRLETNYFPDPGNKSDAIRLGLRLEYELSDNLDLVSIVGYNDTDNTAIQDQTFGGQGDVYQLPSFVGGGIARLGFLTINREQFKDVSQELKLLFNNDRLRAIMGGYYYRSEEREWGFDTSSGAKSTSVQYLALSETERELEDNGKTSITSWSIFGSVEFDFTDTLSLGAELRYNDDELEFNRSRTTTQYNSSFDKFLPKVTLRYQPSDALMLYGNIAQGNKPGNLNDDEGLPESRVAVREESAWSYEMGVKSLWMDDRLGANLALYMIDWDDLQNTTTTQIQRGQSFLQTSILENIGKASIQGLELELSLKASDFWDIYLGYALTDSQVDEYLLSIDPETQQALSGIREAALLFGFQPSGDVLISGTQLPQVSRHQLNLSNTFRGELNADLDWFLRVDFNYNSKRYAQVYNLAHTGSRELVNLRGGIHSQRFDIELWANNLLDNNTSPSLIRYVETNDGTFGPNRAIGLTLPEKRRIGVTARYRF